MGVRGREKIKGSGEWWVFVNYRGRRRAKRVGVGRPGKKAAELAALKISARLAEGDRPTRPCPPRRTAHVGCLRDYVARSARRAGV